MPASLLTRGSTTDPARAVAWKRWAAAVACALSASCSLLLDNEGFSSGSPEAGPIDDAGGGDGEPRVPDDLDADLPDASAADADAETPEDASVTDAQPDAQPTGPCSTPLFRDDFDTGQLGSAWDGTAGIGANQTLSLVPEHVSPPNGLAVRIAPGAATSGTYLRKNFGARKTLCFSTAMLVDSSESFELFGLHGRSDAYQLSVNRHEGAFGVVEGIFIDDPNTHRPIASFTPLAGWRKVDFFISFPPGKGKGSLRIEVDGTLAAQASLGEDDYDLSLDRLHFGIRYASTASAERVAVFDDVVIRTE